MKVLGISGSLRRDSHNRRLLLEAAQHLPAGVELELFDGLRSVEPYDEDDDLVSAPPGVRALREAIESADAVLIATPEYNSSVPGTLKNKPVAVMGATTGQFGGVWAQADLKKILGTAGARVVDAELAIGRAHERLAEDGRLIVDETQAVALVEALMGAVRLRTGLAAQAA